MHNKHGQVGIVGRARLFSSDQNSHNCNETGHVCEFEATLLAMAVHDLRQPLQVVQNIHDRLGNEVRTMAELHLLEVEQRAIDRMVEQFSQLLNALHLRHSVETFRLSHVNLDILLRQIGQENEWAASRKGVQVRLVSTTGWVMSDAFLLTAVLRNIVGNAIKYTDPGGRVLIGCRHLGDDTRIDVLDTGAGISDEQMPKIFDAFSRADSTKSDGLGIGLFIVRQAVLMLGHRIDISSTVSQGTRFSIFAKRARAPMTVGGVAECL